MAVGADTAHARAGKGRPGRATAGSCRGTVRSGPAPKGTRFGPGTNVIIMEKKGI